MFHKAKEVLETVSGVPLLYGSCQKADLQELEPLVALVADVDLGKPWLPLPMLPSAVSSGAVCAAGVPSCIAHPTGQLAALWASQNSRDPVQTPDCSCDAHGPGSYRLTPPVRSYLHRRLSLQGVQEPP